MIRTASSLHLLRIAQRYHNRSIFRTELGFEIEPVQSMGLLSGVLSAESSQELSQELDILLRRRYGGVELRPGQL